MNNDGDERERIMKVPQKIESLKFPRKIESIGVSVANPEYDYLRAMELNVEFCQLCGVGPPIFEIECTEVMEGGEKVGYDHSKYCCKECVIAMLEDMKLYGLELWKNYEAEVDPDDPFSVDLEEHRRRLLQLFGKTAIK